VPHEQHQPEEHEEREVGQGVPWTASDHFWADRLDDRLHRGFAQDGKGAEERVLDTMLATTSAMCSKAWGPAWDTLATASAICSKA